MSSSPQIRLQITAHPRLADTPNYGIVALEGIQSYHHRDLEPETRKQVVVLEIDKPQKCDPRSVNLPVSLQRVPNASYAP
jgi:hypothetical protein